jgi:phytoene/squalene synthetase
MSDAEALAGFVDKWRERWPEWRVAEVFVPHQQREACAAWFALQQELAEAAWGGSDPLPGEAKLGWWAEELQGWARGRRRHPLGLVLQRRPAPWLQLAASLPALVASREVAADAGQAAEQLLPVARAIAAIDEGLFDVATGIDAATCVLMATQLQSRGDAAASLKLRARVGSAMGDGALARAWAADLLETWVAVNREARPPRIRRALLRERLRRFAAGHPRLQPLPALITLRTAWAAARG